MNFWTQFFVVMVAMYAVDWCWAFYIRYVSAHRQVISANWSAGIIVLGSIAVVGYVHDYRLVIAAAIGAWLGTFHAVGLKREG